jgi:aspartyl-tRNA synthetase
MQKYGTDKPDLRNPLEYHDITEYFTTNTPNIFKDIIAKNGLIYMLETPELDEMPRSFFDQIDKEAKALKAKGMGYIVKSGNEFKGPMSSILPDSVKHLIKNSGAFFLAHEDRDEFYKIAASMRNIIGKALHLFEKNTYKFCWIVDFPMYEKDDKGKWDFSHNPFSMPQGGMEALQGDPGEVLAYQYDIVCNGCELSSGAVRNYKPEIMYKAFEIVGYSKEEVDKRFGTMINAFNYGAPPHAGCAPGIDRIVMLLANTKNLRDVIPFPLNGRGLDLMMDAPSELSKEQLKELSLEVVVEEE